MTEETDTIETDNQTMVDQHDAAPSYQDTDRKVPLSALQKERRKRQELEDEVAYYRSQAVSEPEEPAYSPDVVTREEIPHLQAETVRQIDENNWAKENPDKIDYLNQNLENFLKQRPHLAQAIASAPNRYEEAYTLVSRLSPQQQQELEKSSRKNSPLNPTNVPKASGVKNTMDVMDMSDSEFRAWRASRKRR